jgi:hypothetical protein
MASPPASPPGVQQQRPMSAMLRSNRSSSRMSMSSRHGGGSRASDEDGKTAVKVGTCVFRVAASVSLHQREQRERSCSPYPKLLPPNSLPNECMSARVFGSRRARVCRSCDCNSVQLHTFLPRFAIVDALRRFLYLSLVFCRASRAPAQFFWTRLTLTEFQPSVCALH